MKAVVAAFNQEKALVGAFSVITNLRMELFQALQLTAACSTRHGHGPAVRRRRQLREDGGGGALPAGVQLHAVLDHVGGLHRGARHRRHMLQVLIIEIEREHSTT